MEKLSLHIPILKIAKMATEVLMNSINNDSEWHANGTLALALPYLIPLVPFCGDFEILRS